MKKYFIKNGVINIVRYVIRYTETKELASKSYTNTGTIYVNSEYDLEAEKSKLDMKGADYEIETIDVSGIEQFDKMEVSSEQEAEELINPKIETFINRKVTELSDICQQTIFNGVDVTLSNGEIKHFSLKIEDQMNLNSLFAQVSMGAIKAEEGVPYHADGEICTMFSVVDFTLIANTASAFKVQQTTYCNHLMSYVKTLTSKEDIEAVTYGQELNGEFLESYNEIMEALSNEQSI